MLMAEQEPYALMVQPDDMLISPREANDNIGTMVCFHPRYALGDHHNYMDKDDFLREMYLNTVGNNERGMERYERMVNMVWSRKMTGDHPDPRAVDDTMLRVISEKYIVMPLYLLDHSGLAMQTTSFNDPWDSGQVGWVYVSKEDALKEYGAEKMTGALRKKAEDVLRGEVAEYDAYLRGECYRGAPLSYRQIRGIWVPQGYTNPMLVILTDKKRCIAPHPLKRQFLIVLRLLP